MAVTFTSALFAGSGTAASGSPEFFETRIRPVLAKSCFACHTSSRMGGLQIDSGEHLKQGGKDGPVIVPGDPEKSLLIQAVRQTHERIKMPPAGKLPNTEIEDLAAWVKAGAIWPETGAPPSPVASNGEYVIRPDQRAFWSFQPVRKPAVPSVKKSPQPRNEIDRFIWAKLEANGLASAPAADKRTLIRRATFDVVGLPPTPEEVAAFVSDKSPDAFAKVVDRLLASPHYGERWARYWLDYARYADEKFTRGDALYKNAYRYRDWVVQAFNSDMPYDLFVKAQIAADLLVRPDRAKLLPALGFYALSPEEGDDRVDVTSRVFLGLTTGCAHCHDHKFDPIPQKDFYSMMGVFRSTEPDEVPLAPENEVRAWKELKQTIDHQKEVIKEFIERQNSQLADLLMTRTADYVLASWKNITGVQPDLKSCAEESKLDRETLERWVRYLKNPDKEHPFLKSWYELLAKRGTVEDARKVASDFEKLVLKINAEKKAIDDRNYVALGGTAGAKDTKKRQYTNIESLEIKKYYLWRDLASEPYTREAVEFKGGIYFYGPKQIDRWLSGEWKSFLDSARAEQARLEKSLPPQYPFLHAIKDAAKPANARIEIRGDPENLGDEAPRRFLRILSDGEPRPFSKGSGRLELADEIASPKNPLTARVIVNRVWQLHFGHGIVRTVSNFGQLGDRPSHPELLDYLASKFIEGGWSIKALHRQIMLSAAYGLSTDQIPANVAKDPDNRLVWRANIRQRLDAEAIRDAMLAVTGELDATVGGPAAPLKDTNRRRTLYGLISRNKLDSMLQVFDFPDPNTTSEQRLVTAGPLQRLYFMNNPFVAARASALVTRLNRESGDDPAKIARAYQLLYGRAPEDSELQLGLDYLQRNSGAWPLYAQALLSSSEFLSVN